LPKASRVDNIFWKPPPRCSLRSHRPSPQGGGRKSQNAACVAVPATTYQVTKRPERRAPGRLVPVRRQLRYLRPKQHEIDNLQPAQNAVDDCPEYRMVIGVRYRDGKSATKANAILRTLYSNSVVPISVHVAALPAWARTHKFRSASLQQRPLCVGASNDRRAISRHR
jgi:hypothetical protein